MKEYFKNYNRPSQKDEAYEYLKAQQQKDSKALSSTGEISDYAFTQWNSSVYHRDNKGNLKLDKNIKTGFNTPKSINMNKQVPTQKYKKKYYLER